MFAKLLPPQGTYLDLMSSWRSHLPDELEPQRVVGLGMNAAEMADNPQLDEYVVHNLNENPTLPFTDEEFDAAICTVSVQYMTKPLELFREVNRVLQPGGLFIVSFSNRCFPTKAVATWLAGGDREHLGLVQQYFTAAGNWTEPQAAANTPRHADPSMWCGRRRQADTILFLPIGATGYSTVAICWSLLSSLLVCSLQPMPPPPLCVLERCLL
ncbi:MAG: methyltransferase domain-containing protein [Caldilineaceae bacterium]